MADFDDQMCSFDQKPGHKPVNPLKILSYVSGLVHMQWYLSIHGICSTRLGNYVLHFLLMLLPLKDSMSCHSITLRNYYGILITTEEEKEAIELPPLLTLLSLLGDTFLFKAANNKLSEAKESLEVLPRYGDNRRIFTFASDTNNL